MRGKVGLAVGLGAGWVLGSRYGRKGYDELKKKAKDVVRDPRVQRGVRDAESFIGENVPVVGTKVAGAIGKARAAVTDAANSGPSGSGGSSGGSSGVPSSDDRS